MISKQTYKDEVKFRKSISQLLFLFKERETKQGPEKADVDILDQSILLTQSYL